MKINIPDKLSIKKRIDKKFIGIPGNSGPILILDLITWLSMSTLYDTYSINAHDIIEEIEVM